MTDKEIEDFSKLLYRASNTLGMNGCNDIPTNVFSEWTLIERHILAKEYEKYNSQGRDYIEGNCTIIYNDSAMLYLFSKKVLNGLTLKEMKLLEKLLEHSYKNVRKGSDKDYISAKLYEYSRIVNSREERISKVI